MPPRCFSQGIQTGDKLDPIKTPVEKVGVHDFHVVGGQRVDHAEGVNRNPLVPQRLDPRHHLPITGRTIPTDTERIVDYPGPVDGNTNQEIFSF
jgi:hypothetical protein